MKAIANQSYIISFGSKIINAYVKVRKLKTLQFVNVDTNEVHWIGIEQFENNIIE